MFCLAFVAIFGHYSNTLGENGAGTRYSEYTKAKLEKIEKEIAEARPDEGLDLNISKSIRTVDLRKIQRMLIASINEHPDNYQAETYIDSINEILGCRQCNERFPDLLSVILVGILGIAGLLLIVPPN
jgi:hypothetical protein